VRGADIFSFSLRKLKMMLTGKQRTDSYQNVCEALGLLLKPLRP
jgi:hypothetical protein